MPSAAAGVTVKGVKQLAKDLRQAGQDVGDLKAANKKVADIVVTQARANAPKRSGKLAATGRSGQAAAKVSVRFGSNQVPYANPIHWGWPKRHIKANPFLYRAVDETRSDWYAQYVYDIKKIMESVKGA